VKIVIGQVDLKWSLSKSVQSSWVGLGWVGTGWVGLAKVVLFKGSLYLVKYDLSSLRNLIGTNTIMLHVS